MSKASKIISDLAELDPAELKQIAAILESIEVDKAPIIIGESTPTTSKPKPRAKAKPTKKTTSTRAKAKKKPTKKPPVKKKPTKTSKKLLSKSDNKFFSMGLDKEKVDPTDKKITQAIKAGKIQITERDRPLNQVSATCSGCQVTSNIPSSLAYRDQETRKYTYVCNSCLMSRRKS